MADTMENPHVYKEGCTFKSLEDIRGKKITIMGLGLNGGGEACVRFFLKHGATVTVTDMKSAEQLSATINRLNADCTVDKSRLTYVLRQHREEDFSSADCVIKNPGVKFEGNKFLSLAKAIETDLSIFLYFTKAPVIAVTGSKGKSSTVSAIYYGLKNSGFKAFLGGNITVSPLTFLDQTDESTPVVLELSSWQLRDLRGRKVLKPKISVITKIVPDHQNFYGSMKLYVADKKLIYADQTKGDYTILDADADGYATECTSPKESCTCWGDEFASETNANVLRYSRKPLPQNTEGVYLDGEMGFASLGGKTECLIKELAVPGNHIRANVLNAALVMRLMGISAESIKDTLSKWPGIEHRLEHFHDWKTAGGAVIHFYNDSASTVPEAALAAAKSFDENKKLFLLTGGTDKELDFTPLADFLEEEHKNLSLLTLSGTGTDKLISLLNKKGIHTDLPSTSLEELLSSLKQKIATLAEDAIVVFSPGATSFGMFANEFDRGTKFKAAVCELFA